MFGDIDIAWIKVNKCVQSLNKGNLAEVGEEMRIVFESSLCFSSIIVNNIVLLFS